MSGNSKASGATSPPSKSSGRNRRNRISRFANIGSGFRSLVIISGGTSAIEILSHLRNESLKRRRIDGERDDPHLSRHTVGEKGVHPPVVVKLDENLLVPYPARDGDAAHCRRSNTRRLTTPLSHRFKEASCFSDRPLIRS